MTFLPSDSATEGLQVRNHDIIIWVGYEVCSDYHSWVI